MTLFIILVIALLIDILICPRIDYYKDYRDHKHLVIWYNTLTQRKFIHYEWAA